MEKKPFKCDSKACNSYCCRTIDTNVALSVGDFIRLSETLGKPIKDVWFEHGDMAVIPAPRGPGLPEVLEDFLMLGLSLIHDPCHFLSENECSVYNSRPLCCSEFPLNVIKNQRGGIDGYKHLECVSSSKLSSDQRSFWKSIDGIMAHEAFLERMFLWGANAPLVPLGSMKDLALILLPLGSKLKEKNNGVPEFQRERAINGVKAVMEIGNKMVNGQYGIEDMRVLIQNLRPVLYFQLAGSLAEKIEATARKAEKQYELTSREYLNLIRKNQ